mmetsp:Transcript_35449/g.75557  ORF Transcript_35449/g.75557 Transcript_35449/m.75557 type:complete len:229 (+) Transcript_35449:801-1487(+)
MQRDLQTSSVDRPPDWVSLLVLVANTEPRAGGPCRSSSRAFCLAFQSVFPPRCPYLQKAVRYRSRWMRSSRLDRCFGFRTWRIPSTCRQEERLQRHLQARNFLSTMSVGPPRLRHSPHARFGGCGPKTSIDFVRLTVFWYIGGRCSKRFSMPSSGSTPREPPKLLRNKTFALGLAEPNTSFGERQGKSCDKLATKLHHELGATKKGELLMNSKARCSTPKLRRPCPRW